MLIFVNFICCSRLQLWLGYFIYFKFYTCALLFDIFNGCSSSIKEINRLIGKGMCVLLFNVFNGCFLAQLKG